MAMRPNAPPQSGAHFQQGHGQFPPQYGAQSQQGHGQFPQGGNPTHPGFHPGYGNQGGGLQGHGGGRGYHANRGGYGWNRRNRGGHGGSRGRGYGGRRYGGDFGYGGRGNFNHFNSFDNGGRGNPEWAAAPDGSNLGQQGLGAGGRGVPWAAGSQRPVQGAGAPAAVDAAAPEQAVSAEGQSSSMVDVDAANKQAGAMTGFSHQQQTDLQLQAQDVKGKGGAVVSHDSHTAGLNKGEGSFQGNSDMQIDVVKIPPVGPKPYGKNKPLCFRCLTKGHVLTECTAIISCDVCDSDNHVTKACPMVKGAKPTAILCGYAVDGLGFYYIPYTSKQKVAISEPKAAFISVSDWVLSTAQITRELERLVPGWKWVVEEREDKTFSTTFPSAAELQRMIEWGPVHAKGAKGILKITAKKDHAVYKYEIPKAWVQYRGLPDDLREFPILWALGTIFGATREVDMKFTKHFGRPRVKVAVLNPELIPEFVDIVIGD